MCSALTTVQYIDRRAYEHANTTNLFVLEVENGLKPILHYGNTAIETNLPYNKEGKPIVLSSYQRPVVH